jgi:hypothetical protein
MDGIEVVAMKKSLHVMAFGLALCFLGALAIEAGAGDKRSQYDYPV